MASGTSTRLVTAIVGIVTAIAAVPAPAWAQEPADAEPAATTAARCFPAALVSSPTHWLQGAIRRVDLAGSFELASTGTGTLPLGMAVRALEAAARDGETAAVRGAAAAYLERLALEHPGLGRDDASGCAAWADARLDVGYAAERGLRRPGFGYDPEFDWTGAFAVPNLSSPAAGATVTGGLGRLGGRLEVAGHQDGIELRDAHLAAELGDVVLWAGRRAIHYGPAHGGGLVIGGDALVTGVGAVVTDPIRLPWVLGLLGPMGMESFFSRARGGELIVDPWFWGARLTASPHRRLRIGASRATMFGGEGNTPVTLEHALQMLIGMHSGEEGEFDNHFGSVDLRYRPPGTPLDLYLEWAMNDAAGAWWDMPARLVGARWAALPFAPGLGIGAEFAHFPASCCGNPIWYRNWAFRMGWTTDGDLVAHPLGGHGQELSVRLDAVTPGGAAVGHGRVFQRQRGDENLFHPQWGGRSLGAEGSLQIQPGPRAGALIRGFIEAGDGWRAARVFAGLTWLFGR
jgi:hypothetical protein